MWIVYLFYLSMLLPAFSISQMVAGMYFQNRILWIPFGLIYFFKSLKGRITEISLPFVWLSSIFLSYTVFGAVLGWNYMMYLGYLLTSILIVISIPIIKRYPQLYICFFKFFFLCNIIYAFWQIICVNSGMMSLSMMQSNLPAQNEADYFIPFFVCPPFIRYSGLFNESSPFNIYLIICFCFFTALGKPYRRYKIAAFLAILFGGAKIGYLFFICYAVFFIKSKVIRTIAFILLVLLIGVILMNFDLLLELTKGEAMSIMARMSGLEGAADSGLSLFGSGLKTSSNGEVGLDMFSILSGGFGVIGGATILICIMYFFHKINCRYKNLMILPFLLAALGSGSLLILQYSLMVYCLIYLEGCFPKENYKCHFISVH